MELENSKKLLKKLKDVASSEVKKIAKRYNVPFFEDMLLNSGIKVIKLLVEQRTYMSQVN